jgi:transcriptional regulator with GAF, ATPase, and Fis domain
LFITANHATIEVVRLAERLARTDIAILLTGETGAGKDQLSRHIHASSPRHNEPFLPIDLSVLPESLWESEVFGHRKGVFTGASCDKTGLLESANGGTVFFNEIGNLPLPFQAKLLELLDSRKIRRLGDTVARPLDVRFIAATNVDLSEAVAQGRFRADLYYRLAQAPLHLKPLRERREDIIPLIRHFLLEFGVPLADLSLLNRQLWVDRAHNGHWAGNVRQLRSFVHRLVAIAERPSDPEFSGWADRLLEQIDVIHEPNVGGKMTREALVAALERNLWNQRATARDLGITEGGIRHLMRRWGVQRPV